MKRSLIIAACFVALSATPGGAISGQIPCGGAFARCAYDAGGYCTRDNDGQQRIHFWDYPGNVLMFERCVGGIFEAAGQPNPYTTGVATTGSRRRGGGAVSMPRFELHYPTRDLMR